MYGTLARLRVTPGRMEDFRDYIREYERVNIAGFNWSHLYQSDKDPNEFWLAVGFEDANTYRSNAEDPAQHERYMKLRALLDADPEWHDGTIVDSFQG
jgi:hypothetical protein